MTGPLFDRVLVANRGEIACRVISTLRRLGIGSVAVYSDADIGSPHVSMADTAVRLGPAPARESYLNVEALLAAVEATGAEGVHPGYGFLSESSELAQALEAAGIAFIGPTVEQLQIFGQKHVARATARAAGLPLIAGSELLTSADDAAQVAATIGYPVMLKAVAGGGGIGMSVCADARAVVESFDRVQHLGEANFGSGGVFLERYVARARHVEVQVFGDGLGGAVVLGERDCSLQRRNQKVLEETPAPDLPESVRAALHAHAARLAESVAYRSAGTVEFLVDATSFEMSFLEVNARLQVEHPVTEAVWGVDVVEWMVRLAAGDRSFLEAWRAEPHHPVGHAIEVRLYAEDPARDYRPSSGRLTEVALPAASGNIRVDTWIATGTEVTPHYDPLLAKIVAFGTDRNDAAARLGAALDGTTVAGVETNLELLTAAVRSPVFRDGAPSTADLDRIELPSHTIEVLAPGMMTTIQDHPGRIGYWAVGVPPSGPMDDLSFRLGNAALGNPPGLPGVEITHSGPTLQFAGAATICLTGAPMPAAVDGRPVDFWTPVEVPAGSSLEIGTAVGPGLRSYLLVRGGFDVPRYLDSAATFTLGGFGGHGGRALRSGDVLRVAAPGGSTREPAPVPAAARSELTDEWAISVTLGPHGAPEFFTSGDIDQLLGSQWKVHHNSSRTGVRLVGPKPEWARRDGGDAGLHPSNIHDTPYAIGAIDFTGDMPIILGPDGPSLGGFVCPLVICEAERWKVGQLSPGDRVRFVAVDDDTADSLRSARDLRVAGGGSAPGAGSLGAAVDDNGVLVRREGDDVVPELTVRRAGDDYLLVEYGPMVLDLAIRLRVHTLQAWLEAAQIPGIVDITSGIRSLQLHLDPAVLPVREAAEIVVAAQSELPPTDEIEVPSRIVHLPLSWDDPATRQAIERYMTSVRDDAPWCPWNIEFIRRINGLDSVEDVHRIVFDASYLVLGLGDVYLGAPVATPVDPRHRLVTTKYNPARTWTPENAVGIGGAYLCIYGMEGPGGYQFVGRTVQVWNRYGDTEHFQGRTRWLLRLFDQIRWYPVDADELLDMRARLPHGGLHLDIEETSFNLGDYRRFLAAERDSIEEFSTQQQAAFAAERAAWEASGEFDRVDDDPVVVSTPIEALTEREGATVMTAPMAANVWRVNVAEDDLVEVGDVLVIVEAMKIEMSVCAPVRGRVRDLIAVPGALVSSGDPLLVVEHE